MYAGKRKYLRKGAGALWPWLVFPAMLTVLAAYIWLRLLTDPSAAADDANAPQVEAGGSEEITSIADMLPPATPPQEPETSASEPAAATMLNNQFFDLASEFGGEVGIAVRAIDNGWMAGYRLTDPFPQQSVSKLWVAASLLHKVDNGEVDLDDAITLTPSDLSIFHQPIRKKILATGSHRTTLRKLLWYAMTQSDNTANDALLRRTGGKAGVDNFFAAKDLSGIAMSEGEKILQMQVAGMQWEDGFSYGKNFWIARSKIPDEIRAKAIGAYIADPIDGARPAAIASALTRLSTGTLLSPESSSLLLQYMAESKTGPKRLRGGLSAGWQMAHKTGTGQVLKLLATGYNDVGILTSPAGRRYTVVVMIGATNRPVPQRQELMQAVTRTVIQCEENGVAGCV